MFSGARRSELTVGRHDVRRNQVIDREAVLAHQPPEAAAERQSDDTGVRDRAAGGCESECLRLMVQLSPITPPCARAVRAPGSTRMPFIADMSITRPPSFVPYPGRAMTATPNRQTQHMSSSEGHGLLHIGDAGAPRYQSGPAIDIAVPDVPGALVSRGDRLSLSRRAGHSGVRRSSCRRLSCSRHRRSSKSSYRCTSLKEFRTKPSATNARRTQDAHADRVAHRFRQTECDAEDL